MKKTIVLTLMIWAVLFFMVLPCLAEDIISGCYQKNNGQLRVVKSASECRDSEKFIQWNEVGPQGPPGLNCWDTNGNTACDPEEDKNGDGTCTALDCQDQQDTPAAAWCYSCNPTLASTTSSQWTNIPGWAECVLTTTGKPVLFMAEYSIYINANHGGARVMMDEGTGTERIFGMNPQYGLDWQSSSPGNWIKRSMLRVFQNIPAGEHRFRMQFRSQQDGVITQIHGGNCDPNNLYSGAHLFMQELR